MFFKKKNLRTRVLYIIYAILDKDKNRLTNTGCQENTKKIIRQKELSKFSGLPSIPKKQNFRTEKTFGRGKFWKDNFRTRKNPKVFPSGSFRS